MAAVGAMVLVGWAFGIAALKSVLPGFATMKPNTALCFVLSGIALWLLRGNRRHSGRLLLTRGCAVIIAVGGGLSILEDLSGADLGIDQVLFREELLASSIVTPGRMAPATALGFVLAGLAVLLASAQGRRRRAFAQWPALIIGSIGLVAVLGYSYGVGALAGFGPFSTVALHTAVTFAILALGLHSLCPDVGLAAIVSSEGPGGVMARRLLPVSILIPALFGSLRLRAQGAGWFGTEMGVALLVTVFIVVFTGLIWATAVSMNRTDTLRRQSARATQESEERFRSLVAATAQIVWSTDPAGNVEDVPAWRAYTGQTIEEARGAGWAAALHPDDRAQTIAVWQRAVESRSPYDTEYRVRRHDGEYRHFAVRGVPMLNADGSVREWIGFCADIHDRRLAEEQIQKLATAVEQASESVWVVDPKGTIQYVNPAAERTTGYGRTELIGQNPRILKSGRHDNTFYQNLWDTIGLGDVWRGHFVNRRKDGTIYEEETSISPLRDPAGRIVNYVAVRRDVTREVQLEAQFRQAQKMEAIGHLAGGVAHDFNNLLTAILGYAGIALDELPEGDPMREHIEEIRNAGLRAAALTRQLLAFSRKQVLLPEVLDVNRVAKGIETMLRRLIGEDIDLTEALADDLGFVMADPGQIEQVIMNLAVNARDAMPDGGKLTIETANVDLDAAYETFHAEVTPGPYVMLSVTDTGVGMDEKTMERLFEPFFTTKEKGKGTGLGLSTVYGIIKQSRGHIYVYSKPGLGTTFKIYLQRDVSAAAPATKPYVTPAQISGTETILVVEDDDAVRGLARGILEMAGYTVLAASDGRKALLVCEQYERTIHLVLTDVVMPEMGGRLLAERMALVRPGLKALYMSGYANNAIVHHGVLRQGTHFVGKPFSAADLTRIVREVLDTPQSDPQTSA